MKDDIQIHFLMESITFHEHYMIAYDVCYTYGGSMKKVGSNQPSGVVREVASQFSVYIDSKEDDFRI